MDSDFIQARITATKAQIVAYETAVTSLATGEISQYTLDTGQSRVVVTKINIATLNNAIDGLYNRLCTLEARLNGSGSVTVGPGW